jgi:hypothetical protein
MPNVTPSRPRVLAGAPRIALAAAATLVFAVALAACGSSGANKPVSAADAAFKFSRCMREHGIKNFPDPQISGGSTRLTFRAKSGEPGAPTPRRMEAAQNACKHFQAAFAPKLTPQEKVAREEEVEKFAACMRGHGVDIHASTVGGGVEIGIGGGPGKGPNPESPAFQAAQKACQGLVPKKPGDPGLTSQGGGPKAGLSLGG